MRTTSADGAADPEDGEEDATFSRSAPTSGAAAAAGDDVLAAAAAMTATRGDDMGTVAARRPRPAVAAPRPGARSAVEEDAFIE
jgi:hypothetical protein